METSQAYLRASAIALVFGLLLSPASAEQLFVRKRPYEGGTFQGSRGLKVELEPFFRALGLKVNRNAAGVWVADPASKPAPTAAGKLWVNGQLVNLEQKNGRVLVAIEDLAAPLNFRVVHNAQLGTVEVNPTHDLVVATATSSSSARIPKNAVRFSNPALGVEFWAPSDYIIVDDPEKLVNRQSGTTPMEHVVKNSLTGLQFACFNKHFLPHNKGAGLVFATDPLPSATTTLEEYVESSKRSSTQIMAGYKSLSDSRRTIGGIHFWVQEFESQNSRGVLRGVSYLAVVPRLRQGWAITVSGVGVQDMLAVNRLMSNFIFSKI